MGAVSECFQNWDDVGGLKGIHYRIHEKLGWKIIKICVFCSSGSIAVVWHRKWYHNIHRPSISAWESLKLFLWSTLKFRKNLRFKEDPHKILYIKQHVLKFDENQIKTLKIRNFIFLHNFSLNLCIRRVHVHNFPSYLSDFSFAIHIFSVSVF